MLVLNTKVERILNWKTRLDVRAATILTIDWYRKFYQKNKNKKIITEFTKKQISAIMKDFKYEKSIFKKFIIKKIKKFLQLVLVFQLIIYMV